MEHLFGAIPKVLGEIVCDNITDEALVFAAWSRSAGEMLRTRTVPVSFKNKRLTIAVEDTTWQRHLEDLSPTMLAKLNTVLGCETVTFIEFRIDKKTQATVQKAVDEESQAVPTAPDSLIRAANAIADDTFRENFLSAASVYLDRQKT